MAVPAYPVGVEVEIAEVEPSRVGGVEAAALQLRSVSKAQLAVPTLSRLHRRASDPRAP